MLRKAIIALTAAVAIGAAFTTEASARWGHGGGGFHGFRHGGFGFRHGGFHRGWGGWRYGPGFYAAGPGYYAYGSCYRRTWVATPWGWQWRRVWVCG